MFKLTEDYNVNCLSNYPIFYSPTWHKFIQNTYPFQIKYLQILDNDRNRIAVMPLLVFSKFGLKIIGSPVEGCFTPYMGPIFTKNISFEDKLTLFQKIWEFLNKNFTLKLKTKVTFFFGYNENIEKERLSKHFHKFKETYLVEIQPTEEQMWKYLQSRCRNMIRKAEKYNVEIREIIPNPEYINLYYKILLETFKRRGATPFHPKKVFYNLVKYLYPQHLKIFASFVEGNIASMGLFLYNQYHMYYLSGASDSRYNRYAVNNLLQWKVIKFCIENNIPFYDMGGKGIPSIDKFKESFGGKVVSFPTLDYESKIFSILKKLYVKIKNFAKRYE